jgi:hypothetical protein
VARSSLQPCLTAITHQPPDFEISSLIFYTSCNQRRKSASFFSPQFFGPIKLGFGKGGARDGMEDGEEKAMIDI